MADTLTETTQWGNLKTDVSGYVGIDTLQDQIRKKVLKKGFEFNIIVVGELDFVSVKLDCMKVISY